VTEITTVNHELELKAVFTFLEGAYQKTDKFVLADKVENASRASSPKVKAELRRMIFQHFWDNERMPSPLVVFFNKVSDYPSRQQVILLELVKRNKLFCEFAIASREVLSANWVNVKERLRNVEPRLSEPALKKYYAKFVSSLRELDFVFKTSHGNKVIPVEPTPAAFAFGIYTIYSKVSPIVDMQAVASERLLKAALWTEEGRLKAIRQGDGKFFVLEEKPPLHRLVLRYSSLEDFVTRGL